MCNFISNKAETNTNYVKITCFVQPQSLRLPHLYSTTTTNNSNNNNKVVISALNWLMILRVGLHLKQKGYSQKHPCHTSLNLSFSKTTCSLDDSMINSHWHTG